MKDSKFVEELKEIGTLSKSNKEESKILQVEVDKPPLRRVNSQFKESKADLDSVVEIAQMISNA